MSKLVAYLEAVKFELEIFLLVKQLLESVSQNDVCVVQAAVLFIKLVILISTILLLFCLKLGDARGAHFLRRATVGALLTALGRVGWVLSWLSVHSFKIKVGAKLMSASVESVEGGLRVVCGLMKVSHAAVPIKN